MTFEELSMQLKLAVDKEDLNITKKIIELLNNMQLKIEDVYFLINLLSINQNDLFTYTNLLNNICIDYILENLYISTPATLKRILYYRERKRILQETDQQKIENYLNNYLKRDTYEEEDKIIIQTLIELTTHLTDHSKIAHYFSLIQNKFY